MPNLTIQDVFDMFEPFGIRAARVTSVLNACADKGEAEEAFEGLKGVVTERYNEMRSGDVSPEQFRKVKPIYERLMKIGLKNYNPPKRKDSPVDEKVRNAARIYDMLKKKDIAGLSRLLGEEPVDSEVEQNIIDDILSRFNKK
jgi:hypothetical protein